MATQIGKGHIHGLDDGTPLAQADLSGYVSPKIETLRLSHGSDVDRIKGGQGNSEAAIYQDEFLECTFEVIPQGTTIANAKKAAGLPQPGQGFTTSGMEVIEIGSWADALNVTVGDPGANPWIYEGGGSINGFTDQKWSLSLPLRRYRSISSVTAIT